MDRLRVENGNPYASKRKGGARDDFVGRDQTVRMTHGWYLLNGFDRSM